jgi:hypothetical protein
MMPVVVMTAAWWWANTIQLGAGGLDRFAPSLKGCAVGGALGCIHRGKLVAGCLERLYLSFAQSTVAATVVVG